MVKRKVETGNEDEDDVTIEPKPKKKVKTKKIKLESPLKEALKSIKKRTKTSGFESEEQIVLQAMTDSVEIGKLGLNSVTYNFEADKRAYVNRCTQYAVAQALRDNIASTESGLVARDIIPDIDLIAPPPEHWLSHRGDSYVTISDRGYEMRLGERCPPEWRQPAWGFYESADKRVTIYSGRINANHNIMLIYGIQNLKPGTMHANEVVIMRASVKIIDRLHAVSGMALQGGNTHMFPTPALFKRGDEPRIDVMLGTDAIHNYDKFALRGIIVEALGQQVTG